MKVYNLQCSAQHMFEGWFGSDEDYTSQCERGLLACPLCGDTAVHKLPSAPRLNLGVEPPRDEVHPLQEAQTVPSPAAERGGDAEALNAQALQAAWLQAARRIVAETEDVGERFAEEARRIHYGESEERGIRGKTSAEERQALKDEGIGVMTLPLPEGLEGPLQ